MNGRQCAVVVVVILAMAAFPFASGCGTDSSVEKPAQPDGEKEIVEDSSPGAVDGSKTVTMNGRSVMEGWMNHWGFEGEGAVDKNGFVLDYKVLDSSTLDTLATSFADNVDGLPPGSVVFFKFCFADFYGSNLEDLERVVEEVIGTARSKELKLIIGNALPVNRDSGSRELTDEYEAYNDFLLEKARENPNVWIYDFYGVLAGPDGLLKPEYDTGDSHPNDEGYSALDPSFFNLLGQVCSK